MPSMLKDVRQTNSNNMDSTVGSRPKRASLSSRRVFSVGDIMAKQCFKCEHKK